jgi:hypothetical protein
MLISFFIFPFGEGLSASRPNHELEDHPSSAVRDWLRNMFAATLHPQVEKAKYQITVLYFQTTR